VSAAAELSGGNRSEAKRPIQQGSIEEKIDSQDVDIPFDPPVLIPVGKRSFVELI
jgi:hypothetical protein